MFRARNTCARFSTRLKLQEARPFCNTTKNKNNNSNKAESSVTTYDEQYRQLDNLDFMTATKMLFTDRPKKKKFGIDFHLVQLFFACMPSLAVYLVAQYARYEMRKMDAELEQKKKEEEEKAKEMELSAIEEKDKASPVLLEVKSRLDKLEEAIKDIVVEVKKQPTGNEVQQDASAIKNHAANKPGDTRTGTESSSSTEQVQPSKQKSEEQASNFNQSKPSDAAQKDQKSRSQNEGPSQDAKK